MKILIAEPENYSKRATEIYREVGRVVCGHTLSREELFREAGDTDILVLRLAHIIDKEVINAAPGLKIIASPTTGLNHIDVAYAESKNIKIVSLKGETEFLRKVHATSEHTFALLLALMRKLPWNFNSIVSGGRWDRDSFKGRELSEKTLGIIGFGRLGSRVAKIARGFDMNVLAHDPHVSKVDIEAGGATPIELDYLLEHSDIISVHVPLNDETKNLINAPLIAKMKQGVIIVNTSRGEILDEDALLQALESGKISGAALDVLVDELPWGESKIISGIEPKLRRTLQVAERPKEGSLGSTSLKLINYARNHEDLLITSHLGGATYESMEKTEIFIAQKVVDFWRKN